jgi:hypothetical protein
MRMSLMVDMKSIDLRGGSYPWRFGSEHVRTPGLVALEATCTMDA